MPSHTLLFDICHPAHAHFFRQPIARLQAEGHEILITSRDKDCTLELLDSWGLEHRCLSRMGKGIAGLGRELIEHNAKLLQLVRKHRPDVMSAIGGIFVAQVGSLSRTPSLVFYDTENASLQNALTYPFADKLLVPRAYTGKVPEHKTQRYAGYHELSYLHPSNFSPDRERAIAAGLAEQGDTFLLRTVSWQANHDIGENGWSLDLLSALIKQLESQGKVIVSAEGELPPALASHAYKGPSTDLHHLLAHCKAYIGESATMATEAAVLGVPAVYAAETGRGYIDELERRYGLVKQCKTLSFEQLAPALSWACDWEQGRSKPHQQLHQAMLLDCVDVCELVCEQVLTSAKGAQR